MVKEILMEKHPRAVLACPSVLLDACDAQCYDPIIFD